MSTSEGALLATPPPHLGRLRALVLPLRRIYPEPVALVLLAGTLGFWDLTRNGWANTYYSAAVRSMGLSWHNFLFVSLDPSGVMSVDKPPLTLWIQALSVRIFGFHPLAILAPQALMGVVSVLLLYDLTRRRFGRSAGFVAGLALALTPIAVAVSRHNNPDALLVLCCVATLWCALRALESDRLRWYILAGVCLGLGFETKMLVALVVLPGMLAAWVWARPRAEHARAWRGPLAALLALVLVGGAWPALVELTPASQRPWVSGTSDNRVLSLIFGYNGLGRVEGQSGGPQALGGSNLFGGTPGPLRLLNGALGGQAGWMLGFALLGALAILLACRLRRRDARSGWLLCVGGAFLTTAVLFSFARGIFHPYYVSLLAPFSAALVGAGFGQLTARDTPGEPAARGTGAALHAGGVIPALAALAVAAGVVTELAVLRDYPGELAWLTPTLIVCGAFAIGLLLIGGARLRLAVLSGALALLIAAPATWAVETLGHATNGTFPAGGPAGNAAGTFGAPGQPPPAVAGGRGAFNSESPAARARARGLDQLPRARGGLENRTPTPTGQSLQAAVRYTDAHGGGTVAVSSQSEAAPLVIDGARVAGIGGFSGRESETTAAWLAQEVRSGRIRWVLASSGGLGGATGAAPGAAAGAVPGGVQGGAFSGAQGAPPGGAQGGPPGGAQDTPPRGAQGAPFGGAQGGPPGGAQSAPLGGTQAVAPGPAARDARRGASAALSAATSACRRVSSVSGLYDCAGRAARIAAAARD